MYTLRVLPARLTAANIRGFKMNEENKTRALFVANLVRLRKEAGFSQFVMAKQAGLTHNFINDLENMKKNPSLKTLDRLSKALNVDPLQFFIDPSNWNNADIHFLTILDSINKSINKIFDNYRKKA